MTALYQKVLQGIKKFFENVQKFIEFNLPHYEIPQLLSRYWTWRCTLRTFLFAIFSYKIHTLNYFVFRQVPAMPNVFYTKEGKLSRYNLRKFGELPFHLVRCKQFKELYDSVLFNYQWLYSKMSACPLQTVLRYEQ